jgi:cytochrome c-type biogenesis protein CcmE
MKARQKRIALIVGGVALLALATTLVLSAFRDNLVFFFTPSEIAANKAPHGRQFRVGGMVENGSLQRDGVRVSFVVTDTVNTVRVDYQGILPDLFRQGKGVVAQGSLGSDGVFHASEVLAKHDENYMPPEAGHALEQAKKAQATLRE